jgi:hypothetical protein
MGCRLGCRVPATVAVLSNHRQKSKPRPTFFLSDEKLTCRSLMLGRALSLVLSARMRLPGPEVLCEKR